MGTCKMQESKKLDERFRIYQEPIIRSFHLPRLPSESTLSRIFLFLEAPPTGFFAGVYIIANHKRAVVLYCLCHMQATPKYFNNGEKRGNFTIFFLGVVRTSACFRGKLKNPPRISVLKIKRYGTGLTQGYNWYGGSGYWAPVFTYTWQMLASGQRSRKK